jgi:ABC-type multidrug transport system permease subunit
MLLLREYRNGTYSLPSQYMALLTTNMIFNAVYSLFLGLPIYFLVGLKADADRFFIFVADIASMSSIGVSIGMMLGALVQDYQGAQQVVMPTIVPLMLFSGYVIPYKQIQFYFKWLYYISFFQYALSIAEINQFRGQTFSDCSSSTSGDSSCYETGEQYLEDQNIQTTQLGRDFMILWAMFAGISIAGYYVMRYMMAHIKM